MDRTSLRKEFVPVGKNVVTIPFQVVLTFVNSAWTDALEYKASTL